MSDSPAQEVKRTMFADSFGGSLVVPLMAIRSVGPAAETLATVMSISLSGTFVSQQTIATTARIPVDTVKKHLSKLVPDWLENEGRQPTKRGWIRRTVTLLPTTLAKRSRSPYILLPWWARCSLNLRQIDRTRTSNRLSWSEKVLFGLIASRFLGIQSKGEEEGSGCLSEEAYDEDRYLFSLRYLELQTGMDRKTIVSAKRSLHRAKLIEWLGDGETTDRLFPNFKIDIVEKPAKPGYFYISIEFRKDES